jgi:hypothetical protein
MDVPILGSLRLLLVGGAVRSWGYTLSINGRRAVDRLYMQEEACPIYRTDRGAKDGGQRVLSWPCFIVVA